jgi:protein phosphatase
MRQFNKLEIAAVSDVGLIRERNEDYGIVDGFFVRDNQFYFSSIVNSFPRIFAIADGMGGHNAGDVASELTLSSLNNEINEIGKLEYNKFKNEFDSFIKKLHKDMLNMGESDISKRSLGCTLTGFIISETYTALFNIGDSRTYRLRGGFLSQLTKDHSLAAQTNNSSIPHNYITNCIGGGAKSVFTDMDNIEDKILIEDIFMLCSDGLHDLVDIDMMELILNEEDSIQSKAVSLNNAAKKAGGKDNITVILIKFI